MDRQVSAVDDLLPPVTAFLTTSLAIIVLCRWAPTLGLLDSPSGRKQHKSVVPLIGGIAIYTSLLVGALIWGGREEVVVLVSQRDAIPIFILAAGVLVVGGVIDDRYQTGVTLKIATEVLAAVIVIEALDFRITYLGDLIGLGMIEMSAGISYAFTIIAIFGLVNAFNMLDGVDGLLSALVLTIFSAFHIITGTPVTVTAAFLSASVLAFLISNMSVTRWIPKCFLGDAGSRLLGFIAVCFLLSAASAQIGGSKLINPVTALFLVAVPLFDMVFVTLKRTQLRRSPFHADRSHIHHLLMSAGASQFSTVAAIVGANLAMVCLGLILHLEQVSEPYQMGIFCYLFFTYAFVMNRAWNKATA